MITKVNIPCVWGGQLAGVLLKNHTVKLTKKVIGLHGWLDNLNSMLPIAEKLLDRHPNYEIYLYDRAGHGFSSHLPRGCDYSHGYNLRDLRTITQSLGWNKEKFAFLGHSYGAQMAMAYAAAYPDEISCIVAFDSIIGSDAKRSFWKNVAVRIDNDLQYYSQPAKQHKSDLTYEKAIGLMKNSRVGITEEAAKLLTERSLRRDKHNKLYFTRDEALKKLPLMPFSKSIIEDTIKAIQASLLFIQAVKPQWPTPDSSIQLLKEHNPHFRMELIDGSHHFHMTHVEQIFKYIEEYLSKHFE